MPTLRQVRLTTGAVSTIQAPTDLAAVWISNMSPFDLAVSFDPSPVPPPAANLTDYQFTPQWSDVVPARRARLLAVPPSATYSTPQGATLTPTSGKITLFPWPDAALNNFNGSAPCGEARVVVYSVGEQPGIDQGEAQRLDGTPQPRLLTVLPAAWHSFTGNYTFTAAGQSFIPGTGDIGLPFQALAWDGNTTVVVYVYSLAIFTTKVADVALRLQAKETNGAAATYDLMNLWIPAGGQCVFTPPHPFAVRVRPSNGASILNAQITCDGLSVSGAQLWFSMALDVDSRNAEPVPAIGYGELAGDSNSGNVRAAGYW